MAMFAMKIRYYCIVQNYINETRYYYIAEKGILTHGHPNSAISCWNHGPVSSGQLLR